MTQPIELGSYYIEGKKFPPAYILCFALEVKSCGNIRWGVYLIGGRFKELELALGGSATIGVTTSC